MLDKKLRIFCDLDDTLNVWRQAHEEKFKCQLSNLTNSQISKQVLKCRYDKQFWENLPLLELPDFKPAGYCTKRNSRKQYARVWLRNYNLPEKPIYQVVNQESNKAFYIKGVCDVLIDDSYSNVLQCLQAGLPALLITRPHNESIITPYRIYKLSYAEIERKYNELFR